MNDGSKIRHLVCGVVAKPPASASAEAVGATAEDDFANQEWRVDCVRFNVEPLCPSLPPGVCAGCVPELECESACGSTDGGGGTKEPEDAAVPTVPDGGSV